MSRSGYVDDCDSDDQWAMIRYRGAVKSAICGARGQAFLKEMVAALDAMPEKKLIAEELEVKDGAVCAIGAVGKARGIDMSKLDPEDYGGVACKFGIATVLAREIVWENDDCGPRKETPEARWARVRKWAEDQIIEPKQDKNGSAAHA